MAQKAFNGFGLQILNGDLLKSIESRQPLIAARPRGDDKTAIGVRLRGILEQPRHGFPIHLIRSLVESVQKDKSRLFPELLLEEFGIQAPFKLLGAMVKKICEPRGRFLASRCGMVLLLGAASSDELLELGDADEQREAVLGKLQARFFRLAAQLISNPAQESSFAAARIARDHQLAIAQSFLQRHGSPEL